MERTSGNTIHARSRQRLVLLAPTLRCCGDLRENLSHVLIRQVEAKDTGNSIGVIASLRDRESMTEIVLMNFIVNLPKSDGPHTSCSFSSPTKIPGLRI